MFFYCFFRSRCDLVWHVILHLFRKTIALHTVYFNHPTKKNSVNMPLKKKKILLPHILQWRPPACRNGVDGGYHLMCPEDGSGFTPCELMTETPPRLLLAIAFITCLWAHRTSSGIVLDCKEPMSYQPCVDRSNVCFT